MNQTYTDFIKNKPVETVFRIHAILLSIFAIQKLLSKKVDKHTLQIIRKQVSNVLLVDYQYYTL